MLRGVVSFYIKVAVGVGESKEVAVGTLNQDKRKHFVSFSLKLTQRLGPLDRSFFAPIERQGDELRSQSLRQAVCLGSSVL